MSLWILLLAFPIAVANTGSSWRYGAFIDGGSEGSRIYILRWKPADTNRVIISPETVGDRSTEPGIASFAQHPSRAGESLKPLVDYMMQTLKHETTNWAQTPIYLRATAGMRLLFPDQREAILEDIRSFFRTLPFMFRNDMASVATGEEEGVFGWISANYLLGNLEPDRTPATNTTVGSLDLGGASAQIVFMPQKSIIQHEFPLKLGPHRLQLYSFSFLHFGIREAAHSTASRVISDALLAVQSVCARGDGSLSSLLRQRLHLHTEVLVQCCQVSSNQSEDAGDERLYAVPAAHHENFQQGCSMLGGAMLLLWGLPTTSLSREVPGVRALRTHR